MAGWEEDDLNQRPKPLRVLFRRPIDFVCLRATTQISRVPSSRVRLRLIKIEQEKVNHQLVTLPTFKLCF